MTPAARFFMKSDCKGDPWRMAGEVEFLIATGLMTRERAADHLKERGVDVSPGALEAIPEAAVRSLCMAAGTSLRRLRLAAGSFLYPLVTSARVDGTDGRLDPCYGLFRASFASGSHDLVHPVSVGMAGSVRSYLAGAGSGHGEERAGPCEPFLPLVTVEGYVILLNPSCVERMLLVEEGHDMPYGEMTVPLDVAPTSEEFHEAVSDLWDGDGDYAGAPWLEADCEEIMGASARSHDPYMAVRGMSLTVANADGTEIHVEVDEESRWTHGLVSDLLEPGPPWVTLERPGSTEGLRRSQVNYVCIPAWRVPEIARAFEGRLFGRA